MGYSFEDINLYVFNSLQGAFYDVVIWCLGPLADDDDTKDYSLPRCYLAVFTRMICRQLVPSPSEADGRHAD